MRQGESLKRKDTGYLVALPALGLLAAVYSMIQYAVGKDSVLLAALAGIIATLGSSAIGWWLREQRRSDDAWLKHLAVFLVENYPITREDAEIIFAKRWSRLRFPWQPYTFGTQEGPRRKGARRYVQVTIKGVVTAVIETRTPDAEGRLSKPTYRPITRWAHTRYVVSGPSTTTSPPATPVAAQPQPRAARSVFVALEAAPKSVPFAGWVAQLFTIIIVSSLTALFVLDQTTGSIYATSLIGAILAFAFGVAAYLISSGTAANQKAMGRWRIAAAADLVEAGQDLNLSFSDAMVLLHSDKDRRSALRQAASFERITHDYFACLRGSRAFYLMLGDAGWTLTVEESPSLDPIGKPLAWGTTGK